MKLRNLGDERGYVMTEKQYDRIKKVGNHFLLPLKEKESPDKIIAEIKKGVLKKKEIAANTGLKISKINALLKKNFKTVMIKKVVKKI